MSSFHFMALASVAAWMCEKETKVQSRSSTLRDLGAVLFATYAEKNFHENPEAKTNLLVLSGAILQTLNDCKSEDSGPQYRNVFRGSLRYLKVEDEDDTEDPYLRLSVQRVKNSPGDGDEEKALYARLRLFVELTLLMAKASDLEI